jgi:hypothetical protein
MKADPTVKDYYRHFEAPGVGHCYIGNGLYPASMFDTLVNWVEKGVAPDKLIVDTSAWKGAGTGRILCPYPQRSRYRGSGNTFSADSYYCE